MKHKWIFERDWLINNGRPIHAKCKKCSKYLLIQDCPHLFTRTMFNKCEFCITSIKQVEELSDCYE